MAFQLAAFVVQLAVSYVLNRAFQPDGPRVTGEDPASGEYGVPMPRVYGGAVRITFPMIALSERKETEHKDKTGGILNVVTFGAAGALLPTRSTYSYSYPAVGCLIADRHKDEPIEGIGKIWAGGKVLFDPADTPGTTTYDGDGKPIVTVYGKNKYYKSLRVYHGGRNQTPDNQLVAHVGPQPAYKGRAYIVIEELQLENFSNSFPAPLEGLVHAREGQTLAEICGSICAESGVDPLRNLSTTELIDITSRGYAVTSEMNCWDAMKPFFPVYRIDAGEVGGQIRFYERAQGIRASIDADDMGAHEYGNSGGDRITFARNLDMDLPRETSVTFRDPERDYQANTASSQRSEGNARSNISFDLQITLTADEGATAAATAHWDAWLGRTEASFALTDQWLSIEPGRIYALPVEEQRLPYRITRRLRGANGIIEVTCVSDENVAYVGTVAGASAPIPPTESTLFAETVVVPLDMPILNDDHDDFGFYVAVAGSQSYWSRGTVELAEDGTTFEPLFLAELSAPMGTVANALAAGSTTGLDDTLDETSTLTVTLLHDGMTLSSATDAQLDDFANLAFVGANGVGEYLQFKTATKIADRTWLLSNLRRGRRGTNHAIAGHGDGETFVLVSDGGIYRLATGDSSQWGNEVALRGVSRQQEPSEAATVAFTNTGEGKRPFSPVDLTETYSGDDLTLTWTRRSRFYDGELNTDAPETYEIDIRKGATFVKTVTVTEPTWTYPAAEQSADGFTDGDAISACVYQVNADYGRSRARCTAAIQDGFVLHMEDGTTPLLLEDNLTPIGLG